MTQTDTATRKQQLSAQIHEHQQWIQSNRFDSEGVKERQEWIEECQQELDSLGE